MNYQQLEYIIAVEKYRHFVTASEKCFVTQPTLSMMVKKLEEELDVIIFDRSKQPVIPTEIGEIIIEQAKSAVNEIKKIPLLCQEMKGQMEGELQIGIIPTVAPYLIPIFLHEFNLKYPGIKLIFSEITTNEILDRLVKNQLDCGILATPLNNQQIIEHPLYYEEFLLYASLNHPVLENEIVSADLLDYDQLWLLQESHCMRHQIINFCDISTRKPSSNFKYEVGSIETLRKLVDLYFGMTILPELAVEEFDDKAKKRTRRFVTPSPSREISLVTYRHVLKERMIASLTNLIIDCIPKKMQKADGHYVTPIY